MQPDSKKSLRTKEVGAQREDPGSFYASTLLSFREDLLPEIHCIEATEEHPTERVIGASPPTSRGCTSLR
jgi:hypothetical protein